MVVHDIDGGGRRSVGAESGDEGAVGCALQSERDWRVDGTREKEECAEKRDGTASRESLEANAMELIQKTL